MKRKRWISCILAGLFCEGVALASSSMTITIEQVGSNVVATASGSVDLGGLTFGLISQGPAEVDPLGAVLLVGSGGSFDLDYRISGPTNFGSGVFTHASTGTGDAFAIDGFAGDIGVPVGYVSGTPLFGTAVWDNSTLAALGLTPGTYTWSWGSGASADPVTVYAGVPAPSSIPEPASSLLVTTGAIGVAVFTYRWTLHRKH
jgi:hypothetical protein